VNVGLHRGSVIGPLVFMILSEAFVGELGV
jgi:hypothetical protein